MALIRSLLIALIVSWAIYYVFEDYPELAYFVFGGLLLNSLLDDKIEKIRDIVEDWKDSKEDID